LTDDQWTLIEPLLPDRAPRRGGRWRDHRLIVDAVAFKFRTRAPWRELPEEFGPWQTVFHRFTVWGRDGTWRRLLLEFRNHPDVAGDFAWLEDLDRSVVLARRHAAFARAEAQAGCVDG